MKIYLHVLRNGSLFSNSELDLDDEQLEVALKCNSILDGKYIYNINRTVYDARRNRIIFISDEDSKIYYED